MKRRARDRGLLQNFVPCSGERLVSPITHQREHEDLCSARVGSKTDAISFRIAIFRSDPV